MTDLFLFATEVLLIAFCWKLTEETLMITKKWMEAAAIRAVRTMAQTAVATIGSTTVIGGVDWKVVASASALSGILCLLTALAGLPEVDGGEDDEH